MLPLTMGASATTATAGLVLFLAADVVDFFGAAFFVAVVFDTALLGAPVGFALAVRLFVLLVVFVDVVAFAFAVRLLVLVAVLRAAVAFPFEVRLPVVLLVGFALAVIVDRLDVAVLLVVARLVPLVVVFDRDRLCRVVVPFERVEVFGLALDDDFAEVAVSFSASAINSVTFSVTRVVLVFFVIVPVPQNY